MIILTMEFIEIKRLMELTDEEYLHLQYVIEAKRRMLLKKQKKIQLLSKQNAFLEGIKRDYFNYNNYIIKQKQDQIIALELLNNYIKDLNKSGQLSENNIKDAKVEQNKILRELKMLKTSLDKIINDTNDLDNVLNPNNRIRDANYL
jgi:hypothetical protein